MTGSSKLAVMQEAVTRLGGVLRSEARMASDLAGQSRSFSDQQFFKSREIAFTDVAKVIDELWAAYVSATGSLEKGAALMEQARNASVASLKTTDLLVSLLSDTLPVITAHSKGDLDPETRLYATMLLERVEELTGMKLSAI